jgi:hypothetical protein
VGSRCHTAGRARSWSLALVAPGWPGSAPWGMWLSLGPSAGARTRVDVTSSQPRLFCLGSSGGARSPHAPQTQEGGQTERGTCDRKQDPRDREREGQQTQGQQTEAEQSCGSLSLRGDTETERARVPPVPGPLPPPTDALRPGEPGPPFAPCWGQRPPRAQLCKDVGVQAGWRPRRRPEDREGARVPADTGWALRVPRREWEPGKHRRGEGPQPSTRKIAGQGGLGKPRHRRERP